MIKTGGSSFHFHVPLDEFPVFFCINGKITIQALKISTSVSVGSFIPLHVTDKTILIGMDDDYLSLIHI